MFRIAASFESIGSLSFEGSFIGIGTLSEALHRLCDQGTEIDRLGANSEFVRVKLRVKPG